MPLQERLRQQVPDKHKIKVPALMKNAQPLIAPTAKVSIISEEALRHASSVEPTSFKSATQDENTIAGQSTLQVAPRSISPTESVTSNTSVDSMGVSDKMKQLIQIGNIELDPYQPVPSARSYKDLARKYPQLN